MHQKIKTEKQKGTLDNISSEQAITLAKKYQTMAKEIGQVGINITEKALEQKLTKDAQGKNYFGEGRDKDRIIFISFSMSRGQIRAALKEADRVKARVVINGLLKGSTNIIATMKKLRALSGNTLPVIQINPSEFSRWAVVKVPVIAIDDGKNKYRATGIITFDWLEHEIKFLDNKESLWAFGNQGKTYPIVEQNIIEAMKTKLAQYDWKGQLKKTWDNYWERTFNKELDLPNANKDETWYIDPTVKTTKDIINQQGRLLAPKGKVMNPLLDFGVPFKLIIFNPNDKKQVEWAKQVLKNTKITGDIMLLATQINPANGWNGYMSLKKQFNWHVYVLQSQIKDRFMLSGVPAVVEPYNGLIKVKQIKL
ncbi:MAG: TrbC family F-type conjugative pilus assembly protein [Methylococcales bacterium]